MTSEHNERESWKKNEKEEGGERERVKDDNRRIRRSRRIEEGRGKAPIDRQRLKVPFIDYMMLWTTSRQKLQHKKYTTVNKNRNERKIEKRNNVKKRHRQQWSNRYRRVIIIYLSLV